MMKKNFFDQKSRSSIFSNHGSTALSISKAKVFPSQLSAKLDKPYISFYVTKIAISSHKKSLLLYNMRREDFALAQEPIFLMLKNLSLQIYPVA